MSISLIEQLLKLPKKNSPLVISVLLGIIIVGSIGGGLWINNLQNTLEEINKLSDERLTLIDERYKTNFNSLELRVQAVESQLSTLQGVFINLETQLTSVSQELNQIASLSDTPKYHRTRLAQLATEISEMSETVKSSLDEVDTSVLELAPFTEPFSNYGFPENNAPPFFLIPSYVAALFVLVVSVYRYVRKHLHISWIR